MKRELRFKTFEDIRNELRQLGQGPVETTGLWSYFQILTHCAASLENTIKGIRRDMPWWKKYLIGPLSFKKIAADGFFPNGIKGNPMTSPTEREEGDEKTALGRLRQALEEFEKFEGKFSDHPRLGVLNKKQWAYFHAMHLAHHLGHARLKSKS